MSTNFVQLVLTCGSWQEAQRIADALLEQKLVACVEMFDVKSSYRWHGRIDQADEVKLLMETIADHFKAIETTVTKLHSYDTFVLQSVPVAQVSQRAEQWLNELN